MLLLAWLLVLATLTAAALALLSWARGLRRRATLSAAGCLTAVLLGVLVFHADLAMQKLAGFLLMPSGLLWLLLGGLAAWLLGRGLKREGLPALLVFLFYSAFGSPVLSAALMMALERSVPSHTLEDSPRLDALLVLGGGAAFRAGDGDAQLGDFGDRVMAGARLYHRGKVGLLLTSGSSIAGLGDPIDLSAATTRIWTDLGIPETSIRRLPDPKNTTQEIAELKRIAEAEGWTCVGVLSSAWHLPRAARIADRAGLKVELVAADFRGAEPIYHPAMLVPQPGAWRNMQLAAWELVGRALGR